MRMNEFIEHVTREDQPKAVEAPSEVVDSDNNKVGDVTTLTNDVTVETTDHKNNTSDLEEQVNKHVNFRGTKNIELGVSRHCGCNNACAHGCQATCMETSAKSSLDAGNSVKVSLKY